VFAVSKRNGYDAVGEFDITTKNLTVKKGSIVSYRISTSPSFRGAVTIQEYRDKFVKDNIVSQDVIFKSCSTAANFITGNSSNGFRKWKTEDGSSLKEYLDKMNY